LRRNMVSNLGFWASVSARPVDGARS
jgi:hypothetical protein